MKIGTWNVNSVKVRTERLLGVLERHAPDVLCLQELKGTEDTFPALAVREAGYHSAVLGQKTYNGVAILSRQPPARVQLGMQDDVDDPQARLVSAEVGGVHVTSIYVPNGSRPDSPKYTYKRAWLQRLMAYLDAHVPRDGLAVICGDLNIAPDERDVARPLQWNDSVLCVPEIRADFQRLLDWGLVDTFRLHHHDPGHYSWWDYRLLGFPKNNGLRIDHVLATAKLADKCTESYIDRDERKGKQPSDHAPVFSCFEL